MGGVSGAPSLAKVVIAAAMAVALSGCGQIPLKPSPTHVRADDVRPEGAIPAPVQVAPALPPPSPAVRPETYSVVVNNVRVQDLLFALARDAKLNVDIHPFVAPKFVNTVCVDKIAGILAVLVEPFDSGE